MSLTPVQRLKQSKLDSEALEREEGLEIGRAWATDDASYNELLNVAGWHESGEEITSGTLGDVVTCGDPYCVIEFENSVFGGVPSDEMAEGFVAGAYSVWQQVRSEL